MRQRILLILDPSPQGEADRTTLHQPAGLHPLCPARWWGDEIARSIWQGTACRDGIQYRMFVHEIFLLNGDGPSAKFAGPKDVKLKVTFYFGKRWREDIVYLTGGEASSNESQGDKHTKLEYR